jgi:hypothetical protein
MRVHGASTYFETQAAALEFAFTNARDRGYTVIEPENLWAEHVAYGTTVRYSLPLNVAKTGNPARKWMHISLYRMDSGRYELTFYLS